MNPFKILFLATCLQPVAVVGADYQAISNAPIIGMFVPSSAGSRQAVTRESFVQNLVPGKDYPAKVECFLIPETGNALAGYAIGSNVALIGETLIGVSVVGMDTTLLMFSSTNRYADKALSHERLLDAELGRFLGNTRRFLFRAPYQVDLVELFGREFFQEGVPSSGPNGLMIMYPSTIGGQADLLAVAVKAANLVVSLRGLRGGAEIAFSEHLRPVWATRNGVPLGRIATNSVFYTEVVDGKLLRRCVY